MEYGNNFNCDLPSFPHQLECQSKKKGAENQAKRVDIINVVSHQMNFSGILKQEGEHSKRSGLTVIWCIIIWKSKLTKSHRSHKYYISPFIENKQGSGVCIAWGKVKYLLDTGPKQILWHHVSVKKRINLHKYFHFLMLTIYKNHGSLYCNLLLLVYTVTLLNPTKHQ